MLSNLLLLLKRTPHTCVVIGAQGVGLSHFIFPLKRFKEVKNKLKDFKCILLSVKCQSCSGLENSWGLSSLLMLIFARFDLDSVIYCMI